MRKSQKFEGNSMRISWLVILFSRENHRDLWVPRFLQKVYLMNYPEILSDFVPNHWTWTSLVNHH